VFTVSKVNFKSVFYRFRIFFSKFFPPFDGKKRETNDCFMIAFVVENISQIIELSLSLAAQFPQFPFLPHLTVAELTMFSASPAPLHSLPRFSFQRALDRELVTRKQLFFTPIIY
jgi:hypothetical protein